MMNKLIEEFKRDLLIYILFGIAYYICEIIWRGHSHFTMVIVGGICGLIIGHFDEWTPSMNILLQMFLGAIVITSLEFISGYIINIKLGLGVWDYSNQPFNILGQVCPQFSILWFFLSYPAIKIDNKLRELFKCI